MELDLGPLWLTLELSVITTLILLVLGIPLAYWLVYSRFRFRNIVSVLVSMPLVLPPSVLGFYLLLLFSPRLPLGSLLERLGWGRLVFSFEGLVVGSVIFSLPFMIKPIQTGFENLPPSLYEAASTLGKTKAEILWRVLLPNIKPALLSGSVLTFAHTVGEFGVVLMIGGSIPGETRVASIAIYEEVEAMNYQLANFYAMILFAITFLILFAAHFAGRRGVKPF